MKTISESWNKIDMSLKEIIHHFFWIDLPISGWKGQSIEDPIVIDVIWNWVHIEYQVIDFIQQLGRKTWHTGKQEVIIQKDKTIDKVSIILDDDPDNYHNYYFDISKFY